MIREFRASVWREDDLFVAQCLEIDIASQGQTADQAMSNLREAVELFFECADRAEIAARVHSDVDTRHFEAACG